MIRRIWLVTCSLLLLSCNFPGTQTPPPVLDASGNPLPTSTPLPAAEVTFTVVPPSGTPRTAHLALEWFDELTGSSYNSRRERMWHLGDGRWQTRLRPPAGALIRYRYIRTAPGDALEVTAWGEPVAYRLALIDAPREFEDRIAGWTDSPYQGPTGRIIGSLRQIESGAPVVETLVSVGGLNVFSDANGEFRIDGLAPGLQRIVTLSPDGSLKPIQQGAQIAGDSTTLVDLEIQPAQQVSITFQVHAPADSGFDSVLRMAGNLRQFGFAFGERAGGLSAAALDLPLMTAAGEDSFILIRDLYAGTHLRYKYTLGDGLWNAERGPDGAFMVRDLIVPEADLVVEDRVATWDSGQGPLRFEVRVPESTPENDRIGLQLNPFDWFEPLPMWPQSDGSWIFELHGPLDFQGVLAYRYCRNLQCSGAFDQDLGAGNPTNRQVNPTEGAQVFDDQVESWRWWSPESTPTIISAPESIAPRPDFERGVELVPIFSPGWQDSLSATYLEWVDHGVSHVTFTPVWTLRRGHPLPQLGFEPAHSPFRQEWLAAIDAAHQAGLQTQLHPGLVWPGGPATDWWRVTSRDEVWWSVWFDRYQAFMESYASLAQEARVERLVMGGPAVAPALPGGLLPGGSPSGVSQEAQLRWGEIIAGVRQIYSGRLAFELELGDELQSPPAFLDRFDELQIYWRASLGERNDLEPDEMQAEAARWIDEVLLATPELEGLPLILSVEYLSIDGSATGCPRAPDFSCRSPEAFDRGQIGDPDLQLDLWEQGAAINAVLMEAYQNTAIEGFYIRRYDPALALQDKSASVNGKPAADVLWYWYPRIQGES